MTFRKQLGIYLTKRFGSTDNKRMWAEACGLDYNYFVVILSGAKSPLFQRAIKVGSCAKGRIREGEA